MDIKDVLQSLVAYYMSTRQLGHTTLMKRGTSNFERRKVVLLHNMSYARDLNIPKHEVITLNSLDKLHGRDLPLAIDNGTLTTIFGSALHKYEVLDNEITRIKGQRDIANQLAYQHETEINTMRAQPFKTLYKTLWRRW